MFSCGGEHYIVITEHALEEIILLLALFCWQLTIKFLSGGKEKLAQEEDPQQSGRDKLTDMGQCSVGDSMGRSN